MNYPRVKVYQELDMDGVIMNPVIEPVSESEFSVHARIDTVDPLNPESPAITQYITAARETLEDEYAISIAAKDYVITWDRFPRCDRLVFPKPPLKAVVSLSYRTREETDQIVPPGSYLVKAAGERSPGYIVLSYGSSWPAVNLTPGDAVSARITAGWTPRTIPKVVKQAVIVLAAEFYKNREAAIVGNRSAVEGRELPFSVSRLMRQWLNLAS